MKEKNFIFNKTFDKSEVRKLISWFLHNYGTLKTIKLLDRLKEIGFKNASYAGISLGIEDLKIPKIKGKLLENTERKIKKNEERFQTGKINIVEKIDNITKSWNLTNELLKKEVINNFRQTDLVNPLYMMTFSGARGNISQIRQVVGMRGLMSDSQGEIINLPIKSNFKEGLRTTEYFISCYGARKGLVDTALKTANAGYLTRRLIYVAQNQIIKQPNCKTNQGILINVEKKNKSFYKMTKENLIGRVLAKEIKDQETKKLIASKGQDICNYLVKKLIKLKKIYIRSTLSCKINYGNCQLCYGWSLGNGRMSELGETVGIIAAQSIGEPGTQLTMRTFHTGGVFSGESAETINAPHEGIISYNTENGGKKIKTKYAEEAFFTLKEKILTVTKNRIKKSIIKIPKYSLIFVQPKEKLFLKQVIAEISNLQIINTSNKQQKEIKEIKTEISGQSYFDKITKSDGKNIETGLIWILNGNIISNTLFFKNIKAKKKNYRYIIKEKNKIILYNNLNMKTKSPTIKLKSKNLEKLRTFNINNLNSIKTYFEYSLHKKINDKKQFLTKKIKTEKFIKKPKYKCKIGEFVNKGKKIDDKICSRYPSQIIQKENNRLLIRKTNPYLASKNSELKIKNNFLIKKNSSILINYYKKQKTEDIVQGLPKVEELLEAKKTSQINISQNNPHEKLSKQFKFFKNTHSNRIATKKTIEKIQKTLIKKIQLVYTSQGVKISNKHMEIIVKQMTSKVIIEKQADSKLLPGEIIELNKVERINNNLKNKVEYKPIIIGISKLSLSNQSFIAEASFQETTRMLTKAAIEGKVDWLYGLKENLVLGNLIPVGTGHKN
uniref:DNA-directed RNA polymerase n=1 Tax=Euglena archaeoplastidiata TaxID=1188008 RepID=A0A1X9GCL4_9EUGL|nr:RNA polymerase beta'' subunit [Euglena archaeoplastidiata]AKR17881.1 RNA polymerase beta'' subunit [Euglena archaeoplastidiata]